MSISTGVCNVHFGDSFKISIRFNKLSKFSTVFHQETSQPGNSPSTPQPYVHVSIISIFNTHFWLKKYNRFTSMKDKQ